MNNILQLLGKILFNFFVVITEHERPPRFMVIDQPGNHQYFGNAREAGTTHSSISRSIDLSCSKHAKRQTALDDGHKPSDCDTLMASGKIYRERYRTNFDVLRRVLA